MLDSGLATSNQNPVSNFDRFIIRNFFMFAAWQWISKEK